MITSDLSTSTNVLCLPSPPIQNCSQFFSQLFFSNTINKTTSEFSPVWTAELLWDMIQHLLGGVGNLYRFLTLGCLIIANHLLHLPLPPIRLNHFLQVTHLTEHSDPPRCMSLKQPLMQYITMKTTLLFSLVP